MAAQRKTIREAKHAKQNFVMEDVLGSNDVAEDALDKAYLEKETPQSFEATPAMTFVIIIAAISVF